MGYVSKVPVAAEDGAAADITGMPPRRELRAILDLPPEQLLAQIAAAADVALAAPRHEDLLLRALLGRKPDIVEVKPTQPGLPTRDEPFAIPEEPSRHSLSVSDTQLVGAALDNLQVTLTQQWRRAIQAMALGLSGLYGIALSLAGAISDGGHAQYLFAALVLGGPIAWTVRDLTAWLERLTRRG
jgi:hypothetical protein